MNQFAFTLFVAVSLNIHQVSFAWTEFELVGFDNIVSGTLWRSNLQFHRYEKTTYGIDGPMELLQDLSNDWQLEMVIYHSALGNNQYVRMPYKVPKDGVCNFVNGMFTKSGFAKELAEASDFPEPKKNEDVCKNYKKGNYTIRKFLVRPSLVPRYLPTGLYKVEVIHSRKDIGEAASYFIRGKLY